MDGALRLLHSYCSIKRQCIVYECFGGARNICESVPAWIGGRLYRPTHALAMGCDNSACACRVATATLQSQPLLATQTPLEKSSGTRSIAPPGVVKHRLTPPSPTAGVTGETTRTRWKMTLITAQGSLEAYYCGSPYRQYCTACSDSSPPKQKSRQSWAKTHFYRHRGSVACLPLPSQPYRINDKRPNPSKLRCYAPVQ